jgi:ethanolamine utilization protein EutA (predicted chaperonin)
VILVFPICQLLVWLIFRCKKQRKQPGAAEGDLFAKGQSGMLLKFGETDRGNLACSPDFTVRRSFLGDFVVAPAPDALRSPIIRRGDGTRAPLRRSFRVTVIISAVPSGGELTE